MHLEARRNHSNNAVWVRRVIQTVGDELYTASDEVFFLYKDATPQHNKGTVRFYFGTLLGSTSLRAS